MCRNHIKTLVDSVSNVVMKDFFSIFINFDRFRMNIRIQCERLFSKVCAWLRDDFDALVREVLFQAFINCF